MIRILATAVYLLASAPSDARSLIPEKQNFVGVLVPVLLEIGRESDPVEPLITLTAEPDSKASAIGRLESLESVEIVEWSYELIGLSIYGYTHDGDSAWYKIYIPDRDQFAWIKGRDGFRFRPLSELVSNSLSYLTGQWDRTLFPDPSSAEAVSLENAPASEVPIEIASTARIAGRLWLLVVVLKESPCASAEAPAVAAAGWVPALSANGHLNVWFYSRGC